MNTQETLRNYQQQAIHGTPPPPTREWRPFQADCIVTWNLRHEIPHQEPFNQDHMVESIEVCFFRDHMSSFFWNISTLVRIRVT